METVRRLEAAATTLITMGLLGCGRGGGDRPSGGSTAARALSAADSSRAARVTAPSDPQVTAICTAVAAFWRKTDSTDVRQVDSVLTPFASDTAVSACVVLVHQEHSPLENRKAPVDTAVQRLGTALALVRGAGPGWVPIYRYSADGPDGSDLAYQRGRVRCLVEQSWDGGDDSDSTYVPADWFKEQTTCWLMPSGIAVSDTAP